MIMEKNKGPGSPYDIKGRYGMITGAASGIGKAAAIHLAGMGAGVALLDLNGQGLEQVKREIQEQTQAKVVSFTGDASDEAVVREVVEKTAEHFGAIDFLVNSAGILRRSAFFEMPVEEWDRMVNVNLRGPFLCCRYAGAQMVRQGKGVIVNVASLAGRSASVLGGAHYTTVKHGVIGLSRHLARELGPKGLRVNAFCPGATMTPMILQCTPQQEIDAIANIIPRRQWATPEEQAAVIGFLVSDASANITGACIDSNGGSLMV